MTERPPPAPADGLRLTEIAAVAVFVLGLVGWLLALPSFALILREWKAYPDPGDAAIGLLIFGPLVLFIAFLLLVASVGFSLRARRLPRAFHALAIASHAAGCLAGLAIIYRALS